MLRTLLVLLVLAPALPAAAGTPFFLSAAARTAPSLDQAVATIRQQTGGRILSAETVVRKGRRVHRIKVLLPNGHVRIFYIKAE